MGPCFVQAMLLCPVADGVCRVELAPLQQQVGGGLARVPPVERLRNLPVRPSQEHKAGQRHRATSQGGGRGRGATPGDGADPAPSSGGGGYASHHRHGGSHSHAHLGGGSTSSAEGGGAYDMSLAEHGESILILTAVSRETGLPVLVETITLLSDMRVRRRTHRGEGRWEGGAGKAWSRRIRWRPCGLPCPALQRVRSVQRFDGAGSQCLYLIREARVIDR